MRRLSQPAGFVAERLSLETLQAQRLHKRGRRGALKAKGLGAAAGLKLQDGGVQAEPPRRVAPGAVAAVASDGAAAGGQLGANLVLAPGL